MRTTKLGRRSRPRAALAVASCAALVAFAGCDQTDDEDYDTHTERTEQQLVPIVEDRTPGEVESVTCPDDLDLSVGERYECDVTMTDGQAYVAVIESTSKREADFVKLTKVAE